MPHDFKSEENRRRRLGEPRIALTNYMIHGNVGDLEATIKMLEHELDIRKTEIETGVEFLVSKEL